MISNCDLQLRSYENIDLFGIKIELYFLDKPIYTIALESHI